MSIDNFDARFEDGAIQIGIFQDDENQGVISIGLERAIAFRDALGNAILNATAGQSRWCCPSCRSLNVHVSFPTWYRETPDFTLLTVNVDGYADIQWWYCDDCEETDDGSPAEVEDLKKQQAFDEFDDPWSDWDQHLAQEEGWAIFEAHGYLEIESCDTNDPPYEDAPEWESEDDLTAHVEKRAAAGSAMHQRALAIHRKYEESIRKAAFGEDEEES